MKKHFRLILILLLNISLGAAYADKLTKEVCWHQCGDPMELTGAILLQANLIPRLNAWPWVKSSVLFKSAQITLELLRPFMGELINQKEVGKSTKSINRLMLFFQM
ncbi:hypothetical protein CbuG_0838 [Coxiella burnetii CbuG_Q212]|nr:hypothetical protein CbuG_0838 [Coxiella burnetii CbuG_Q212]